MFTWAVPGRLGQGTPSPVSGSRSRPKSLAISVKCGLVKQSIKAVLFRLLRMSGSTVSVSKIDLLLGSSINFRAPRYLAQQAGVESSYECETLDSTRYFAMVYSQGGTWQATAALNKKSFDRQHTHAGNLIYAVCVFGAEQHHLYHQAWTAKSDFPAISRL